MNRPLAGVVADEPVPCAYPDSAVFPFHGAIGVHPFREGEFQETSRPGVIAADAAIVAGPDSSFRVAEDGDDPCVDEFLHVAGFEL